MVDISNIRDDSLEMIGPLINQINHESSLPLKIKLTEELCYHFQILATGSLYVDCKPEMFYLNLCRSAENWRRINFLTKSHKQPLPPSSKISTLFACIAAGNTQLAGTLICALDDKYQPNNEYKDDYIYSMIFRSLVKKDFVKEEELLSFLSEYEDIVDEDVNYRVPLIKSILDVEQDEWNAAFENAQIKRESFVEEKARNFATPVTAFAVDRNLWLEGLAFIFLAERVGLVVSDSNIVYCPPLARKRVSYRYENDWAIKV